MSIIYIYITIKEGYEFEREQEDFNGRSWREERRKLYNYILTSKNNNLKGIKMKLHSDTDMMFIKEK